MLFADPIEFIETRDVFFFPLYGFHFFNSSANALHKMADKFNFAYLACSYSSGVTVTLTVFLTLCVTRLLMINSLYMCIHPCKLSRFRVNMDILSPFLSSARKI